MVVPESRPAEKIAGGSATLAAILIGILGEFGIVMGPYTQAGVILIVGWIAAGVTAIVSRNRRNVG